MDFKDAFEKTARSNALAYRALKECQKLLCPEWGDCADALKDGEKCACGFEEGPFANAVPKNREAERLRAALETAIRWLRRLEDEYPGCLNDDAISKHLQSALLGRDRE